MVISPPSYFFLPVFGKALRMNRVKKLKLVLTLYPSLLIALITNSRLAQAAEITQRADRKLYTDYSGYIFIDCGIEEDYTDPEHNILYQADKDFVKTGESHQLSPNNTFVDEEPYIGKQLNTLRSFPYGEKNCYTLKPKEGKSNKYIIRAGFAYRNYDQKNDSPIFKVYLGVDYGKKIEFGDDGTLFYTVEVIHFATTDIINVCLENIGKGTPFISLLELWLLTNDTYPLSSSSQPLELMTRSVFRMPEDEDVKFIRYWDDVYGRVWYNRKVNNCKKTNTSKAIDTSSWDNRYYKLPREVLSTAVQSSTVGTPLSDIYNDEHLDLASEYYIYLHFFDFDEDAKTQRRNLSISFNERTIKECIPKFWKPYTLFWNITKEDYLHISVTSTSDSQLPAMLNAFEIYRVLPQSNSAYELQSDAGPGFRRQKFVVPLVASIAAALVIMAFIFVMIRMLKRKRQRAKKLGGRQKLESQAFSYSDICTITENLKTVIGRGGFGKVYLGALHDGRQVAVKILSELSRQGSKEFQSEVHLLATLNHRNVVSLVGYCNEGETKALIYDYMAGGNLQHQLSDKSPNVLNWNERLQIAVDAAQGLDYLHNGCRPAIVHRDLKSSNILLTEYMQAKIADFGLSRVFANDKDSHVSTCKAGTPGYLDPEFDNSSIKPNKKSDVYSFGIILLELITGQPALRRTLGTSTDIVQLVKPKVESGDIQSIIDPRLQGNINISSAWKFIEIAMCCTLPLGIQRPDTSDIVSELKECLALEISTDSRSLLLSNSYDTGSSMYTDSGIDPVAR